ncbi:MAG: HAD hydrolase-like protein [Bacteroidales bacterium]|nr:HAD hydrolase-like protein [Bacteroidales bacterium]
MPKPIAKSQKPTANSQQPIANSQQPIAPSPQPKALIFDWGDTIMRDYNLPGPMHSWEKVAWIPGAEEALKALQNNYTLIIATSANHSNTSDMKTPLAMVGADKYFDLFFSQIELGVAKPDPRFFSQTALLSGFKPESCTMIGNLYEKDIVGAKTAGMTTIFFNETKREGPFPLADHIIHHMNELIPLLNDHQR